MACESEYVNRDCNGVESHAERGSGNSRSIIDQLDLVVVDKLGFRNRRIYNRHFQPTLHHSFSNYDGWI